MKLLLKFTFILITASLLTYACNQSTGKPTGYGTGRDTVSTVVVYVYSALSDEYRIGQAVRFSWDTTLPDPKDKTRNIPARDTVFSVFVIDNIVDSLGNEIKNTKGGDSITFRWQPVGKRAILKDLQWDFQAAQNEERKMMQQRQKK